MARLSIETKGKTMKQDTKTKSEKATAARQKAINRRMADSRVEKTVPLSLYPAYVPVKPPFQRLVYDAPGCVIRSPLDEARLA